MRKHKKILTPSLPNERELDLVSTFERERDNPDPDKRDDVLVRQIMLEIKKAGLKESDVPPDVLKMTIGEFEALLKSNRAAALRLKEKNDAERRRPKGFVLDLLMPADRAEDALFNILGRYDYWVEKHGAFRARCIFITQSLGAVLSFWTDWLLKRAKLLRFLRPS
jgi:hypothetical protein